MASSSSELSSSSSDESSTSSESSPSSASDTDIEIRTDSERNRDKDRAGKRKDKSKSKSKSKKKSKNKDSDKKQKRKDKDKQKGRNKHARRDHQSPPPPLSSQSPGPTPGIPSTSLSPSSAPLSTPQATQKTAQPARSPSVPGERYQAVSSCGAPNGAVQHHGPDVDCGDTRTNSTQRGSSREITESNKSDEESLEHRRKRCHNTDPYREFGHRYCRIGDPFDSIEKIIEAGMQYDSMENDEIPTTAQDSSKPLITIEERRIHGYNILCKAIPGLRDDLRKMNRQERRAIAKRIKGGRDKARADDTSPLKVPALNYVHIERGRTVKIKSVRNKSLRGFNNKYTAKLLVPLEYGFSKDVVQNIKKGDLPVTAKQAPAFLYPDGHSYNAGDELAGFGYGHYAIRVAKHIFQGPSSALEGPGFHKGKSSNASLCSLDSMTPEAFAYVMVQARYALSSQPEWSTQDNSFDVVEFYWELVNILRLPRSKSILEFYNEQLFGRKEGMESNHNVQAAEAPRQLSMHERMALAAEKRPSEEEAEAIAKRARLSVQGCAGNGEDSDDDSDKEKRGTEDNGKEMEEVTSLSK
ncbi:hypothetical protein K474DRAFT_1714092 [Panus rudis PR-1116 ss-1]|nr:hypothetical protein K474DRAFT_1714092 [Panus rudis PR-1116 ss-1]